MLTGNAKDGPRPSAMQVAREFFALAKADAHPTLTTWKLQKLLYYAQAWSQHERGEDLFSDSVRAWKDGPVVPSVYHPFKGLIVIPDTNQELNQPSGLSDEERLLVHGVWQLYRDMTGDDLRERTHQHAAFQNARVRAHLWNPSPLIDPEDMRAEIADYLSQSQRVSSAFIAGLEARDDSGPQQQPA